MQDRKLPEKQLEYVKKENDEYPEAVPIFDSASLTSARTTQALSEYGKIEEAEQACPRNIAGAKGADATDSDYQASPRQDVDIQIIASAVGKTAKKEAVQQNIQEEDALHYC